jgi:hypothetical protein
VVAHHLVDDAVGRPSWLVGGGRAPHVHERRVIRAGPR